MSAGDQVKIRITADTSQLGNQLNEGVAENVSAAKEIDSIWSKAFKSIMGGVGLSIGQGVASLLKSAFSSSMQMMQQGMGDWHKADQVLQALDGAIENSGKAAGWSTEQIKKYADQRERLTGTEAEDIMKNATQLTSFENIQGDEFIRTLAVAEDMAAKTGQSMQASMQMVAQAIESPTQAMSRLTRAGVRFTEEEQRVVDSLVAAGKMAEAQGVILERLEGTYGGMAEKSADPFTKLGNVWGNLREELVDPFMGAIYKTVNAVEWMVDFISQNFIPVWKAVADQAIEWVDVIVDQAKWLGEQMLETFITILAFGKTLWDELHVSFLIFVNGNILGWTRIYEWIKHIFTVEIPKYVKWFYNNGTNIIKNYITYVIEQFQIMSHNIKEIWNGILNWIKTGNWEVNLKSPTDALKKFMKESFDSIPGATERSKSEFEKNLEAEMENLTGTWNDTFRENRDTISKTVKGFVDSLAVNKKPEELGESTESGEYRQYESEKEDKGTSKGLTDLQAFYEQFYSSGQDKTDTTNALLEDSNDHFSNMEQTLSNIETGISGLAQEIPEIKVEMDRPSLTNIGREVSSSLKDNTTSTRKADQMLALSRESIGVLSSISTHTSHTSNKLDTLRTEIRNLKTGNTGSTFQ